MLSQMNVVFLANEEDDTASLIQGYLQTLDHRKYIHSIESKLPRSTPDILILDLDYAKNIPDFLNSFSKLMQDGESIAYCQFPESITEEEKNLFSVLLSKEHVRLDLSRHLSDLQKIVELRKHFVSLSNQIIGASEERNSLIQQIKKILKKKVFTTKKNQDVTRTVLIQGESGSGKELVARLVACGQTPFISVNCSAIPETLFDSELFGHAKGAFTGADRDRKGLFEEANGGILYLDEIGEMPLSTQAKLLRVLQEGEIRAVGTSKNVKISVRVIAATNRDLRQDVLQGKFREDLYYRLNIFPLYVPALRERPSDIPLLARHFAKIYAGRNIEFHEKTMKFLQNYPWPGNIRELENAVHRAVILSDTDILLPEDFSLLTETALKEEDKLPNQWQDLSYQEFKLLQEQQEIKFLKARLHAKEGSVSKVAKELGMARTVFYARAKRLGLSIKDS